jgi:hypothetical protein
MMACPPPEALSAVFDLAVHASGLEVTYHSEQPQEIYRREDKRRKFTKVSANEDQKDNQPIYEQSELFKYQQLVVDYRRVMIDLESCWKKVSKDRTGTGRVFVRQCDIKGRFFQS